VEPLEPLTEILEESNTIIPIEVEKPIETLKIPLKKVFSSIKRVDSPSGKWDVSLKSRLSTSKASKAKLHISIHANAYGTKLNTAHGTEGYYSTDRSKELVSNVQANMIKGCKNRGVKKANFYITREFPKVGIESVLFEGPFMTCKSDLAKLKSDTFRKEIAQLYAIKIYNYCLKYNIDRISIGAGHGKFTKGKRAFDDSLREWSYNSEVVKYIIAILEKKEK